MKYATTLVILMSTGVTVGCQTPPSVPAPGGGAPTTPSTTSAPSAPSTSQTPPGSPAPPSSPVTPDSQAGTGSEPSDGSALPGGENPSESGLESPGGTATTTAGTGGGDPDERLDASLEDFDEAIAGSGANPGAEDFDILDPMGEGAGGPEFDEPIFEEAEPGETAAGSATENDTVAERAAAGAPVASTGGSQSGADQSGAVSGPEGEATGQAVPVPDDVGDGRDDNIVMRQIREAAMKERDPELREKLWDEYRRIRDAR